MSLEKKIENLEKAVSAGMHEVYSGLNRPDYGVPPRLGGDSPEQINWLAFLVVVSVGLALVLGWLLDSRCRGALMEGRPHFWAILLLLVSYLLLIPGLINPVFSFSIVINVLGHRKDVEPEAGHPVCTETTSGLAHLLWKTGSKIGAFLVILFSMVIPAFELVMLVCGEAFRFASARCAEIFRWVILWVQHRSKWASPDMFAYVLLVNLVRTLDQEPLILSRARLEIGFSCFSTFVVTATVSSLGVPLPQVGSRLEAPRPPVGLRLFGETGLAIATGVLTLGFAPLFAAGLRTACMSFHIETKQLFPPYGPLPASAKPFVGVLDLQDLLRSETSIISCVSDYLRRLDHYEANTILSLALILICVVGSTLLDMFCLVLASLYLARDNGYISVRPNSLDANRGIDPGSCRWIQIARVARKLSMLDVAMVGVYLVTVCMSMYAKYGVVVSLERGMLILLGAEAVHALTYHLVESAFDYKEDMWKFNADIPLKPDENAEVIPYQCENLLCGSNKWPRLWRLLAKASF
mmetsp:Transcript_39488/g.73618  ORF Transcript_39488/g.73618 Transcript_39488/m.73618 type:complete len:523 (-) Transcript_39488:157-1725(-)